MEILAPVGNFESFFAALEKGADAVYLGLKSFSARAFARNFSLEELSYMVPYAHKRHKKVFVALNSIIKETELNELCETATSLSQIKPDAIIVQDLGVFFLFKNRFPHLRLHASTLMAAHNLAGVRALSQLGFKRIVLARELTLEEITAIRQATKAELEVFVHGALCFSYSGLCLASSYLGGYSSLRGKCRQPCRFLYKINGQKGYFLSCGDLCGLELVPRLKEIGIDSIKIEGRMKSAEYVASVVEAYRLVRDASLKELPAALQYARSIIQKAGGRRLTTGFFLSSQPQDVISPSSPSGFGAFLGRVIKKENDQIFFVSEADVNIGDRLRAQSETLGKGISWKVTTINQQNEMKVINAPQAVEPGYLLFRVISQGINVGKSDKKIKEKIKKEVRPIDLKISPEVCKRLKQWARAQALNLTPKGHKETWWIKHEQVEFFLDYHFPPNTVPILSLTMHSYSALIHHVRRLQKKLPLLTLNLPAVILPAELPFFKQAVRNLVKLGFKRWHLGNIGHLEILPKDARLILSADYTFNLSNHLALRLLKDIGVQYLTLSPEMDKMCLKVLSKSWGTKDLIMLVYARLPIFTSRLSLKTGKKDVCLVSPLGERYYPLIRDQITYILPENPFSLGKYLEELKEMGITNFCVDLRFQLKKQIRKILKRRGISLPQGHLFNYKRGWK